MSLEKHIKIIFENLKIENKIDFFNLWKETFTPDGFAQAMADQWGTDG